jgi:uncharacterized protein involved in exopolysaccharide biosynthesis
VASPESSAGPHETAGAGRDYAFRVYAVDDADEIRLADVWNAVWRGKWLIGASAIGGAVLFLLLSFAITPAFRSSVLASPTTQALPASGLASLASQFAGIAALAGFNTQSGTPTAEAIATLESRAFTERFMREHELLPILSADNWDAEAKSWRDPDEAPTLWKAYTRFDNMREIEQELETGMVRVTVDWSDARLAAEWANALVADVNRILRARAMDESAKNLEFLRAELTKSSAVPLQATLYALVEAEMKNSMFASVRQEYAFRVVDPAVVSEKPYWPNRLLFTVLGFAAGLVIGTFWAAVRGSRAAAPLKTSHSSK